MYALSCSSSTASFVSELSQVQQKFSDSSSSAQATLVKHVQVVVCLAENYTAVNTKQQKELSIKVQASLTECAVLLV
jgi:hypothetical protein